MLQFDMKSKELKNMTVQGPRWHGNIQYPGMLYVQNYGPQGIFLVFGGDKIWSNAEFPQIDDLITWDIVSVFEPASGKWFDQLTSGNTPSAWKEFCVAGIASDNQTVEVFLYAGWDGSLGTRSIVYDEIYILTLPAFHWIKVDYTPVETRQGHTCHAVGGSQVLVIGGVKTTSSPEDGEAVYNAPFKGKDKFEQGLAIFDMTTLKWSDRYIANATNYKQSELVRSFYAQN